MVFLALLGLSRLPLLEVVQFSGTSYILSCLVVHLIQIAPPFGTNSTGAGSSVAFAVSHVCCCRCHYVSEWEYCDYHDMIVYFSSYSKWYWYYYHWTKCCGTPLNETNIWDPTSENRCKLLCKNQQTVKLNCAYVHPQHQLKECQRHHRRGFSAQPDHSMSRRIPRRNQYSDSWAPENPDCVLIRGSVCTKNFSHLPNCALKFRHSEWLDSWVLGRPADG